MTITRVRRTILALGLGLLLSLQLVPKGLTVAEAGTSVPQERPNLDARKGAQGPSATQSAAAKKQGLHVSWNEFGTPRSIYKYDGYLARGLSQDPVEAARSYLESNQALFGISDDVLSTLELLNDSKMVGSDGHAVIFRQTFGDLRPTHDGRVTVGVANGKIAYASSSLAPFTATPEPAQLSAADAVGTAMIDAGYDAELYLRPNGTEQGWTLFDVGSFDQSRARLTALAGYDGTVRPAWEALVIDGDHARGYRTFVDAVTGKVLVRQNLVDDALGNPRWKYFRAYPTLTKSNDTRKIGCWILEPDNDLPCDIQLKNDAARVPWDTTAATGSPNFTTKGNAANTAESALSPFTPSDNYRPTSPTQDYTFNFSDYWHDSKCTRVPQNPDPAGTDTDAAITNLFAMHNRMHDWQYFLGFTEDNFNLQEYNFDKGGQPNDPQIGNAQA
ncbi:MAG: M36 family metallopeptidase, partial [Actinobacteria bacterium]|nr:M36 family metallopeptidase [Actinomycetota bacterium]